MSIMENLGPLNILRIPLSNLWDAPNIRERIERADAEFGPRILEWYCGYKSEDRTKMRNHLEWALQNPTYDFKNVLINVKTPNEDILFYFDYLLNLIKQDDCPDSTSTSLNKE